MNCQWWTGGLPWYEKKGVDWSRLHILNQLWFLDDRPALTMAQNSRRGKKNIWMVHSNLQKKKKSHSKSGQVNTVLSFEWITTKRRNKNIRLISNIAIKNLQFSSIFSPAINIRGRDFPWACHVRFLLRLPCHHIIQYPQTFLVK